MQQDKRSRQCILMLYFGNFRIQINTEKNALRVIILEALYTKGNPLYPLIFLHKDNYHVTLS